MEVSPWIWIETAVFDYVCLGLCDVLYPNGLNMLHGKSPNSITVMNTRLERMASNAADAMMPPKSDCETT